MSLNSVIQSIYRAYIQPNPPERVVLDAVSSLTTSIIRSLKLGIIRGHSFNVPVRRDVFNYLFKDFGSVVHRKRGRLYNRCDFNDNFFCNNNFVYCNINNGVCVVFPIYMYSYVLSLLIKLSDCCSDFCETVSIILIILRNNNS